MKAAVKVGARAVTVCLAVLHFHLAESFFLSVFP
jgi:hypothetical protein